MVHKQKCPKCSAGEWKDLGDGDMQCYNCGYSVMQPVNGMRGGMKVTIKNGKMTTERLSEEDLDRIGIPKSMESGTIGIKGYGDKLPNPDQLNEILVDAITKHFKKSIMKRFNPNTGKLEDPSPISTVTEAIAGVTEDINEYNERFGKINAGEIPEPKDRRIAEQMKHTREFMESFKSETIERFLKELFYGDKAMFKLAEGYGIKIVPFVIELISHGNDAERMAHNLEYFFQLSKQDKINVITVLTTMAFTHVAQASGHADWNKDIFRIPRRGNEEDEQKK